MSTKCDLDDVQLVKDGPNIRERISDWVTVNGGLVSQLRQFREQLQADMDPEPWTSLYVPAALLVADLCDSLNLTERERAEVLGPDGERVLAAFLGTEFTVVESGG